MNLPRTLVLASNSPRRQDLLRAAGFDFQVITRPVLEEIPSNLEPASGAEYLAQKKAEALSELWSQYILLAADTIVVLDNHILGKPSGKEEASQMLRLLSGKKHQVITGVSICTDYHQENFSDATEVEFNSLADREIDHYVNRFDPVDKAGAYGIQEWIGMIGIKKINGSYFNVVGLPTHLVYQKLSLF